jgi:hypothetical protein
VAELEEELGSLTKKDTKVFTRCAAKLGVGILPPRRKGAKVMEEDKTVYK